MAAMSPRLRLVAGYAIALLLTVSVVSAVTFVLFRQSLARDLHTRIARDVEQVSEVLAARGVGAFAGATGAELLEGEAARISITDGSGRVVAGDPVTARPAITSRVIAPGGHSYVVDAVAQPSAAESRATHRLGLLLLLSPVVALVLAGGAGIWLADRALRPVEEAYERERRFVADAAHELRTPVTFLQLGIEELRADGVDQLRVDDLAIGVSKVTKLVQELLELSRLQRAPHEACVPTDVAGIAEDLTERFRPLAEARGLDLRAELPAHAAMALASPDGVERVLSALLDNAVAYTRIGTITIGVRNGQRVYVDVSDTGLGIAAERLDDIFEPFVSAGPARERDDGGGSGLGLAIARQTARGMGAELQVTSVVGEGSTFSLALDAVRTPRDL